MAVPRRDFFAQSQQVPTQIDENEHDDPHVLFESHVVITTDTDPIDSRARGVGWVAWFALALVGSAKRHRGVAGRSSWNLGRRVRLFALGQLGP